jgi:chloramphenicol 3-O phosphotransferase
MAHAGNDVVMDYVFSEPWRLSDCLQAFEGLRVVFVGVHCQLEELERRELERGDREIGLAQSQFDVVHSFGEYDIEVNSDQLPPQDAANMIAASLLEIGPVTAFDRLRAS